MITANRVAPSFCAAALLAGCGGSQPPIGAPSVVPQTLAVPRWEKFARKAAPQQKYKSIYSFSGRPDGANPLSRVVPLGKTIYGTTSAGGRGCDGVGCGVVFAISPSNGERIVYRFHGNTDGAQPMAELTPVGRTLYGSTYAGGQGCKSSSGDSGCGTVFAMDTDGNKRVLHRFSGQPDGAHPDGSLIAIGTMLYGTTLLGGASCTRYELGCGTVFSIDSSGHERVLYRFAGQPDGSAPNGNLVYLDGELYGTTSGGGANGGGAVFAISLKGKERIVYSSAGLPDMVSPYGLVAMAGMLYGSTTYGGANQRGTVYAVTTSGSEHVIHNFNSNPMPGGFAPFGRLIAINGLLYGTTRGGGDNIPACNGDGCGVVFSMTPSGNEHVLHRFKAGADGLEPFGGVTDVFRSLYGTTGYGGTFNHSTCPYGCGTVFHFAASH